MGLVLAFGLSLALGRYEDRRAAVVDDANAIGTTYLRAQTLSEPMRSQSLRSAGQIHRRRAATHRRGTGQRGRRRDHRVGIGAAEPALGPGRSGRAEGTDGTAPRLYEESLNEMIDQQTVRVAGLNNRVPTEVLLLEVIGAAGAMFLVGLHVGLLGRSLTPLLLAAGLVTFLLFVTFDLDRPTRGFIEVPDAPLAALRASMNEPPAYGPPWARLESPGGHGVRPGRVLNTLEP